MMFKSMATVVLLTLSAAALAADWPNWMGPNHNGAVSDKLDGARLAVEWKADIGIGFSSVTVADGRAYATGWKQGPQDKGKDGSCVLCCFDAAKGEKLWELSYPAKKWDSMHEGGSAATPVVKGKSIFLYSRDGELICVADKGDKAEISWQKNLAGQYGAKLPQWGHACSPLVLGELVILDVGGAGASTVALKAADGAEAWKSGDQAATYSTPVPFEQGGKTYLAMMKAKSLVVLDAAKGTQVAEHKWQTQYDINAATPLVVSPPAPAGGAASKPAGASTIFISSGYNHGCALLKFDGQGLTEQWMKKDAMQNQFSNCVLSDGHAYGMTDQGELRCVDLASGEVKWGQKGLKSGGLMLAGQTLVVLADGGELSLVSATPEGYKKLAGEKVLEGKCWTMPTLADGRIYCRNAAGKLVCVSVGK
jgi:outer membrane protein assembly factor BamB